MSLGLGTSGVQVLGFNEKGTKALYRPRNPNLHCITAAGTDALSQERAGHG